MDNTESRAAIWDGDRLERRQEAEAIEKFIVNETEVFQRLGRDRSIVLGIDAPYGKGKSWFLERLASQLALSHPVARIDAWADDVGDEPLTAFMAAIDDSLAPYLSTSKKLGDRMVAAKAAALPVIGKLASGAFFKMLSKVAGDEIDEKIGTAIEDAVRDTKDGRQSDDHGAAAAAMSEAFDKLGAEIDSLVDRQGAAMLAAYRQRKQSRHLFRQNMRDLVSAIDPKEGHIKPPLIVIIDELDRCRPNYAIRMLEEIKHFFEVPGVVFILGLHGGQLSKSIKSVYGNEFDSDDYLRRFFTRRYELLQANIENLVFDIFNEWKIDEDKFIFPSIDGKDIDEIEKPIMIGKFLSEWQVTPREIFSILDGLRLFLDGWNNASKIEPIYALNLIVNLVRGHNFEYVHDNMLNKVNINGLVWHAGSAGSPARFHISQYLRIVNQIIDRPLVETSLENFGNNPARNHLIKILKDEISIRRNSNPDDILTKSHLCNYTKNIKELSSFIMID